MFRCCFDITVHVAEALTPGGIHEGNEKGGEESKEGTKTKTERKKEKKGILS
jgi:hypothetical protein